MQELVRQIEPLMTLDINKRNSFPKDNLRDLIKLKLIEGDLLNSFEYIH